MRNTYRYQKLLALVLLVLLLFALADVDATTTIVSIAVMGWAISREIAVG